MNPKDSKIFLSIVLTSIYAISGDCPNMRQFAFDLGMKTAQPAIWTALQSDCCTADGVTCNGQRVTEIDWPFMGLNGFINETAIPSSLTNLYFQQNYLIGNIPSNLPDGLLRLALYNNRMSGDLLLFPSTLQYLWLGWPGYPGNHFTGSLRLNKTNGLRINDNWITDVVIQDSNLLGTGGFGCDLSNNPLLGNPNINGLTACTKNGLYSAGLLPVTISTKSVKITTGAMAKMTVRTTMQLETTKIMIPLGTMTGRTTEVDLTSMESLRLDMTTTIMMTRIGQTTNGTRAYVRWTSTAVGTVLFVQEMAGFDVNLRMIVRVFTSAMILSAVFIKTPFMRELKKKMRKKEEERTTRLPAI